MPDHARREVESCLRDLANHELHELTWVQGQHGGPASPSELVCQLFDDTALDKYLSKSRDNPIFSDEIDALLVALSEVIDEMDLNASPALLLSTPQWRDVQEKAAAAAVLIAALRRE